MSRLQQPRTQTLNIDEKYETYLASNGEPKDDISNPLNLFDGLNTEDKAWFTLAKVYMNQNSEKNL